MLALLISRQCSTATAVFCKPNCCGMPALNDACETKLRLVAAVARPNEPNIGRYRTGCGVGIEALASPIRLQAMKPPLMIISGLTPKKAGRQSTRSASLPG